jgi:transcriptional regulator with XRE-family HTH domain
MPHRIAERLRFFREKKGGWSKGELARQLGYRTVATVSHWETGKRVPTPENLKRIAALLDCTVEELDPNGEAFSRERRPARRNLQKSRARTDTSAVAPHSPPPEAGVLMDPGGLLDIPDADEFRKILGVYLTLDTHAERAEFVRYARSFVPGSAKAKKVRR